MKAVCHIAFSLCFEVILCAGLKSWGWDSHHAAMVMYGTPLENEELHKMFGMKSPPITKVRADVKVVLTPPYISH